MGTPFAGQTILVAASEERVDRLAELLRSRGASVIPFPTVRIVPPRGPDDLDASIRRWSSFEWVVFTSTNGVAAVASRARAAGIDLTRQPPKVAAVGPATKATAESLGLCVSAMPEEYRTDALGAALGDVCGQSIFLPRSALAREALAEDLRGRGANVVEVDAYDATLASPDPTVVRRAGRVDYVVFTSASAARNLRTILPHEDFERLQSSAGAFCIGPVAAEAAREIGFHVVTVAEQHTVPGLVHALEEAAAHG